MTKHELIDYCLTFPGVYLCFPFDETTAIIKHHGNGKMMAAIDEERLGKPYLSLKCEPMKADFLRQAFNSVEAAWHFNKNHWIGITIDGDVTDTELYDMIQHSYDLTRPKPKRR